MVNVSKKNITGEQGGKRYEDPDGSYVARSAGQHGQKDRVLARGTRFALLRLSRGRRRHHARLAKGWPAAARSQEQRGRFPNRRYASLRKRRERNTCARQYGETV